jgi:hypothetical protein
MERELTLRGDGHAFISEKSRHPVARLYILTPIWEMEGRAGMAAERSISDLAPVSALGFVLRSALFLRLGHGPL